MEDGLAMVLSVHARSLVEEERITVQGHALAHPQLMVERTVSDPLKILNPVTQKLVQPHLHQLPNHQLQHTELHQYQPRSLRVSNNANGNTSHPR